MTALLSDDWKIPVWGGIDLANSQLLGSLQQTRAQMMKHIVNNDGQNQENTAQAETQITTGSNFKLGKASSNASMLAGVNENYRLAPRSSANDTQRGLSVDRTRIIRLQVCWKLLDNWGPLRLRGEVIDMVE